jgi:hypothetical protein
MPKWRPSITDYTNIENRLTRNRAIRAKCLDCCCGSANEVRLCPSHGCPLWPYRLGSEKRSRALKTERYVAPAHLPVMLSDGRILSPEERRKLESVD